MEYSLDQELLINSLAKEKVSDLQRLLHEKNSVLSDQQREGVSRELRQYQELLYLNRLNRQIELR